MICWLKTVWRTLTSAWFIDGILVDGHDYVEQDDGSLVCEICGKKG